MTSRKDRAYTWAITILVLLITNIPYIIAARNGGEGHVFGGLLINPLDGNSYLAKMHQGYAGFWRFTLPYTAEPGTGAYLHMYYLALGHLARLLSLSIPLVYNLARALGALLMLRALARFCAAILPETRPRRVAFALGALGAGLGWLAVPFGAFTADLWVAEAYPFLSAYANPHFPLGLALILWLTTPIAKPARSAHPLAFTLGAFLLGIISPFGVAITVLPLSGIVLWEIWQQWREHGFQLRALAAIPWQEQNRGLAWVLLGGIPVLVYDFLAIRADPVLSAWDAQNITPSPPWWDLLLAFSPVLLLAVPGAVRVIRQGSRAQRTLLGWVALGGLLIVMPIGLQRRFLMGLYIPLAGLAALGIEHISRAKRSRARLLIFLTFLLFIPTNALILLSGQHGVRTRDPHLYLTRAEMDSFDWLTENTPADALILAAPETGMFLPAYTGQRVIYGHPFETINAPEQEQAIIAFFTAGRTPAETNAFLTERRVDYIYHGPREQALGALSSLETFDTVYQTETVVIYRVTR